MMMSSVHSNGAEQKKTISVGDFFGLDNIITDAASGEKIAFGRIEEQEQQAGDVSLKETTVTSFTRADSNPVRCFTITKDSFQALFASSAAPNNTDLVENDSMNESDHYAFELPAIPPYYKHLNPDDDTISAYT